MSRHIGGQAHHHHQVQLHIEKVGKFRIIRKIVDLNFSQRTILYRLEHFLKQKMTENARLVFQGYEDNLELVVVLSSALSIVADVVDRAVVIEVGEVSFGREGFGKEQEIGGQQQFNGDLRCTGD